MIAEPVWKALRRHYLEGKSNETLKALIVASVTSALRDPDRNTLRSIAMQLIDLRAAARAGKISTEAGEVEKVLSGICIGLADAYLPKEDQELLNQSAGKILRRIVSFAEGGVTNSMLQRHFEKPAQSITNHLKTLKTRRLIERIGVDGDQREKRYFPTQLGRKIVAGMSVSDEMLPVQPKRMHVSFRVRGKAKINVLALGNEKGSTRFHQRESSETIERHFSSVAAASKASNRWDLRTKRLARGGRVQINSPTASKTQSSEFGQPIFSLRTRQS